MTSLTSLTSPPTIPCPRLPLLGLQRCPSQASTWGPSCWQFPAPGYKPSHPPASPRGSPLDPRSTATHPLRPLLTILLKTATLLIPWCFFSCRPAGWFVFTQHISASVIWCILLSCLLPSIPDYNIKSMRKTCICFDQCRIVRAQNIYYVPQSRFSINMCWTKRWGNQRKWTVLVRHEAEFSFTHACTNAPSNTTWSLPYTRECQGILFLTVQIPPSHPKKWLQLTFQKITYIKHQYTF